MGSNKKILIWVAKIFAFFVGFSAGAFGGVLAVAYFVGRNEPRLMGYAIWILGPVLGFLLARLTGHLLKRKMTTNQE